MKKGLRRFLSRYCVSVLQFYTRPDEEGITTAYEIPVAALAESFIRDLMKKGLRLSERVHRLQFLGFIRDLMKKGLRRQFSFISGRRLCFIRDLMKKGLRP